MNDLDSFCFYKNISYFIFVVYKTKQKTYEITIT